MECPGCHSLNPDASLSCSLCGMALFRREDPYSRQSKNEPLIGASYASAAVDDGASKRHARQAFRFIVITMLVQGSLAGAIYMHDSLMTMAGSEFLQQAGTRTLAAIGVMLYAWVAVAYSVAKTGQSLGMGFWMNFGMALFPPMLPAALARIGHRSAVWTYVYLSIDVLLGAMAWNLLTYAPVMAFLVLVAEIPLVIYHLTGCSAGSIAEGLGLNAYAATIWACAAPLALVIYLLIDQGIGNDLINAILSQNVSINASTIRQMLDPSIVFNNYTAVASIAIWALVGWTFWIKSVYESLKYPLF